MTVMTNTQYPYDAASVVGSSPMLAGVGSPPALTLAIAAQAALKHLYNALSDPNTPDKRKDSIAIWLLDKRDGQARHVEYEERERFKLRMQESEDS